MFKQASTPARNCSVYQQQTLLLATWMVSQKAFKELDIELGAAQGKSHVDVIAMGNAKKVDVLDNKHSAEHGSNGNDVPLITARTDALRAACS